MLLQVWRQLVDERGQRAPRLVVAGSPAHGGLSILREFTRCELLRDHVVLVSGVSSSGLRRLMTNARAVSCRRMRKDFGLPIIEALSVGTPVLASDLPAHREVGGDFACYIDPADEAGWLNGIRRMCDAPEFAANLRRHIATYQPVTEASYFARVQVYRNDSRFGGRSRWGRSAGADQLGADQAGGRSSWGSITAGVDNGGAADLGADNIGANDTGSCLISASARRGRHRATMRRDGSCGQVGEAVRRLESRNTDGFRPRPRGQGRARGHPARR